MIIMGTVWDRTTDFLGDKLAAIVPIALLAIFLPHVLGDFMAQAGMALGRPALAAIRLALVLPALWGQLAITALALDSEAGAAPARRRASGAFAGALLVMIVLAVALAALAAPMAIVQGRDGMMAFLSNRSDAPAIDLSMGIKAFIGLYLLIFAVLALAVGVRLCLVYPLVVAERLALGAIARSFVLTRRTTFKLIGVYLLFFLVFAVAGLATRSVFGSIAALIAPGTGPVTAAQVVVALLGGLVTTAFYVMLSAFAAKLYLAARGPGTVVPS
ncbi:hypothetical protein [uncultured Sphingomonas sp.]|uniref:hypothetical protein n=1 Tax=uncultured Sphingomonas sp. TaxID=158754 RepID=UPI0035CBD5BB